ncbi:MAG: FKBP-type peptidyl-prolyl cis-trans isomerase [Bacteroidales bacterium]|nr:FKBP-type peptidyl-prolyl cis-trans isomerase [Bacteroidales bacterium]
MRKLLFIISFWVYVISVSAQSSDTITTESGLKYYIVEDGDGEKVQEGKEVTLHGIGTLENGEVFWETRESNSPFQFVTGKNNVIKGVEEGVSKMRVGDRWIFILPPEIAYGVKQRGPIPPNSTLVFDYEVLDVSDPKKSIIDTLYKIIESDGIDQALDMYQYLKDQKDIFNFRADQLNVLGYKLIGEEKHDAAEVVLELNAKEHPDNFNVWDSLGEIYMVLGKDELAVECYEKSLELYPKNTNATEMIRKIKAKE